MGTTEEPAGPSLGAHALTRALPVGSAAPFLVEPAQLARDVAATTHGADAADIAALGATILATLVNDAITGPRLSKVIQRSVDSARARASPLSSALAAGSSHARDPQTLRSLAPDGRAVSALAGAIYVVTSFPERDQLRDALLFAAAGGEGGHVATTTGALLGAAHGVEALPTDWMSRLELGWVGDVLAQDLVTEFVEGPSGSEYAPAYDEFWWDRYPGW